MSTIKKPGNVRLLRLDLLNPWDQNYRSGDIPAIKRSIEKFGFNGALRVRGETVMAGNQSLLALREIRDSGGPAPAGVIVDGRGHWMVPTIDLGHLSDQDAIAFAIADNKTHDLGVDDAVALNDLLKSLVDVDLDLATSTGFTEDDLTKLLKPPVFEPTEAGSQGELDRPSTVKCPECGHEFPAH